VTDRTLILNYIHMTPAPVHYRCREPGSARPRSCTCAVSPSSLPGEFVPSPLSRPIFGPPPTRRAPLLLVVLSDDLYTMLYSPTGPQLLQFICTGIFLPTGVPTGYDYPTHPPCSIGKADQVCVGYVYDCLSI
jgi:hypothetical protein